VTILIERQMCSSVRLTKACSLACVNEIWTTWLLSVAQNKAKADSFPVQHGTFGPKHFDPAEVRFMDQKQR
jgi:hypothetical protein